MDNYWLYGCVIASAIITIGTLVFVCVFLTLMKKREQPYNAEFPADFPNAKLTSADRNQRDRFNIREYYMYSDDEDDEPPAQFK